MTASTAEWTEVTASEPCMACGHNHWCTRNARDPSVHHCMRAEQSQIPTGFRKRKDCEDGSIIIVPADRPERGDREPTTHTPPQADAGRTCADFDSLDTIYRLVLTSLPLIGSHRLNLEKRGLTSEQIGANSYRSLGQDRWKAVDAVIAARHEKVLPSVPGFFYNPEKQRWSIAGSSGILIPVRDLVGRIVAIKIRADQSADDGRYRSLSSKKHGGPSPGSRVHIPAGIQGPTPKVRVVEGELKADVTYCKSGLATIGIPGAGSWRKSLPILGQLHAETVVLAYDADASRNTDVAAYLRDFYGKLCEHGFVIELERWNESDGKGIDDLLAAGKHPELVTGEAVGAAIASIVESAAAFQQTKKLDTNGAEEPEAAAFSNLRREFIDGSRKTTPLRMEQIIDDLRERTGDWPRRVDNAIFVDDPEHGIGWLEKCGSLFGWIHRKVGAAGLEWKAGSEFVAKDELFSELSRTSPSYRQVERFPHFPPVVSHYYACSADSLGDGSALRGLIERFSPATDIDRDLIVAMIATFFWGGPGGTRPAFVITADKGRGVGKSKLVSLLARLVGGAFDVSLDEPIDVLKKRLLTADAMSKRVAQIDNVKTQKLSWAELEGLITAPEISGHRLFQGERTRPNLLTWVVTLNGPALSRDMAQRCVTIKLGSAAYSPNWEEEALAYIETRRQQIIADAKAFFESEPERLERCSRWGMWEKAIIARLPEPSEAQRVITERQAELDSDLEEASEVEDYFADELEKLRYDPDCEWVHIPSDVARDWYVKATGVRCSTTAMTRSVNQAAREGTLKRLRKNPSNASGRGLLWGSGSRTFTCTDLKDRQKTKEMVGDEAFSSARDS